LEEVVVGDLTSMELEGQKRLNWLLPGGRELISGRGSIGGKLKGHCERK